MRSTVSRIYDPESLSAIDGVVLDLEPQSALDQLAELAMLGRGHTNRRSGITLVLWWFFTPLLARDRQIPLMRR
jgi:hypothetical protein